MPTLLPARKRAVIAALVPWMEPEAAALVIHERPSIGFQDYDWGLGCAVRPKPGSA
jgi:hypothetical protein